MGLSFRHTLRLGPLRLTASPRGLGVSLGLGSARLGLHPGRLTTTVRLPGTGWVWRSSRRS